MSGLRNLLKLPEAKMAKSTAQVKEFGKIFRQRMDRVNRKLRVTATQASPAEHQPLEGQRMRLFKAFQKTTAQIDPADPAKADKAIERLLAALDVVEGKAMETAEGVTAVRDLWLEREAEFDDALQQIGELADAEHAKAATLRKFGDAIRSRANDRNFQAAVTALDQLLPKLEKIYDEHQRQTDEDADTADVEPADGEDEGGAGAPREGLTILVRNAESGDAVEGAEVQIGDQSDTTSSYGLATVELPVGTHDYAVTAEGFESSSDSVEIIEGDNPELVIEMTAGTDAREGLTVLVQDTETGDAIENVRVTVGDQSDTTSSNGLATVELPVGTHSYEALGDGYEGASGEVEVIEGDNPELVIEMGRFSGPREGLTVLVRDQESSEVLEGVDVTVGDQFDVTSSNGLATVELPVGMHSFEATAENYDLHSGDVEIIEGDNPELIIELTYDESCDDVHGADEVDEAVENDQDDGDLTDELADAERFVGLWADALADVSQQVENLRQAMSGSDDPETRSIYKGLANVMDKFPDLDLRYLVADAQANDQEAFDKTLEQTAREIRQVRDLLTNGPLLSTIDENPFTNTNVHATVNRVLNEIVDELDVKIKKPKPKRKLAKVKLKTRQLKKITR